MEGLFSLESSLIFCWYFAAHWCFGHFLIVWKVRDGMEVLSFIVAAGFSISGQNQCFLFVLLFSLLFCRFNIFSVIKILVESM